MTATHAAQPNAVHGLLALLARTFTPQARRTAGGRLDDLLDIVLATCGWMGTPRQAAEARPYLETLDHPTHLRTTLWRLGIETRRVPINCAELTPNHTPCLVEQADGCVCFVVAIDEGSAELIRAGGDRLEKIPLAQLSGDVWHIRSMETDRATERQRASWVQGTLGYCLPYGGRLFMLSCAINVVALLSALFAMTVYDFAIPARSMPTLAMLLAGALAAIGLEFMLRRARAEAVARLVARFDSLVATATYAKVLALPLSLTETAGLGTQLARFRQFRIGSSLFTGPIAAALLDLPFTLVSLALLVVLGGAIAFVPVAVAVVLLALFLAVGPTIAQRAREAADLKNRSDNLLVEIATKRDVIVDADMTAAIHRRAGDLYNRYLLARFRAQQLEAGLQAWSQTIVSAAGIGVLGLGALRVIDDTMTTGALMTIMAVVWRVLFPIQTVCLSLHRLQQFVATLGQIDQLMKMKGDTADTSGKAVPHRCCSTINFRDVTMRYPGRLEFGLKAMTTGAPPGALVAVTGPSGSGKSTLLKAALGLYPVQAGRITIDGVDLRQLDGRELRQSTFLLPQDPVLFYGTIAQNIRLTAPDATDDEVAAALAAFGITLPHPLLPEGLATRVGGLVRRQSAAGLSQRIALAAAFVRPRPLMLLDCPAQHLDDDGDALLRAALERGKRRSTTLIVTQRPSHMKLADHIVVMRDGEIIGQGPPAAMLPRVLNQQVRGAHAA